jgi:hypothetical protein
MSSEMNLEHGSLKTSTTCVSIESIQSWNLQERPPGSEVCVTTAIQAAYPKCSGVGVRWAWISGIGRDAEVLVLSVVILEDSVDIGLNPAEHPNIYR